MWQNQNFNYVNLIGLVVVSSLTVCYFWWFSPWPTAIWFCYLVRVSSAMHIVDSIKTTKHNIALCIFRVSQCFVQLLHRVYRYLLPSSHQHFVYNRMEAFYLPANAFIVFAVMRITTKTAIYHGLLMQFAFIKGQIKPFYHLIHRALYTYMRES